MVMILATDVINNGMGSILWGVLEDKNSKMLK